MPGATGSGDEVVVAAKGAPEAIADLCHLDAGAAGRRWPERWRRWPREGLRVLGVARGGHAPATTCPRSITTFRFEFVGLLGFEDPLRPTVPAAVAECQRRRRPRGDDHRRLPGHRAEHRPPGGARQLRDGDHRARARPDVGRGAGAADPATSRSSPASCRSRSCASSTRSRPTARSSP